MLEVKEFLIATIVGSFLGTITEITVKNISSKAKNFFIKIFFPTKKFFIKKNIKKKKRKKR